MADDPSVPEGTPQRPPPSTGDTAASRPSALPGPKITGTPGKVVVPLSSLAKAPPISGQPTIRVATPEESKEAPQRPTSVIRKPPPLPSQTRKITTRLPSPVSLAPAKPAVKNPEPEDSLLVGPSDTTPPRVVPEAKASPPPPLPATSTRRLDPARSEPKKATARLIPPIKLNQAPLESGSSQESIFVDNDGHELEKPPEGWKQLEPGELHPVSGDLLTLEVFARSHPDAAKENQPGTKSAEPVPSPEVPPPVEAKAPSLAPSPTPAPELIHLPPVTPAASVPATLQAPVILSAASPAPVTPPAADSSKTFHAPPSVSGKAAEKSAGPGLHAAPRVLGGDTPAHPEHLRPQPVQTAPSKPEMTTIVVTKDAPESSAPVKAPALNKSEPASSTPLPALPAAGLSTVPPPLPDKPVSKVTGPITVLRREKPAAAIVAAKAKSDQSQKIEVKGKRTTALSAVPAIKPDENKPALRPAVLPNKLLPKPGVDEPAKPAAEIAKVPAPVEGGKPLEIAPPVKGHGTGDGTLKPPVDLSANPAKTEPVVKRAPKAPLPLTRAQRAKRRQTFDTVFFYLILLASGVGLYFGGLYFSRETRMEGQIIPPAGMPLNNEVWLVNDFRSLTSGIAEDLAAERSPLLQEVQERQDHVQRAQADIALREERVRLLQGQIQSAKDEAENLVKQARDATQQLWDGPGAAMDADYEAHLDQFQRAVAERAKSLKLHYVPDDSYRSPEVWANAYRLALYEVPPGVDGAKERVWLDTLLRQWRDFLKTMDAKKEELREKAAQIKTAPASKLTDLNARIDELQHRIEVTQAEEEPVKAELQQAQSDLAQAQAAEAGLDDKYYKQLNVLPEENIVKHIPVDSRGRFTWIEDSPYAEGEKEHRYWIFIRATRADGRQYWSMVHFSIAKNETLGMIIDPESFISTKAILRPDLSPDEQAQ